MGKMVLEVAAEHDVNVAAVVDHADSPLIGTKVAGTNVTTDVAAAMSGSDVYIDFSTPAATAAAARAAAEHRVGAVVGTTGLDDAANQALDALAEVAPVLVAANFSLGVNLMLSLAESAARALGPDFDLEVVELHHTKKRDAPSGTAIAVADSMARGRNKALADVARYSREGDVGPRTADEIGVVAVRGGDIIGEHTAYFIGQRERIEITHRAATRSIFADGALRAATWLSGKPAGRYTMRDVLGL
jgi:4-hydroxy-tetrahydrodipicolinate reductase